MGFFNEDFYKELDKNFDVEEDNEETIDEFDFGIEEDDEEEDFEDEGVSFVQNMNLEVNKNNKEKFKDIMNNAAVSYDSYWDLNNPIIRFILVILFVIIAVGLLYYVVGWITMFLE